jgi:hypothetical protein
LKEERDEVMGERDGVMSKALPDNAVAIFRDGVMS